jgi:epoxyqueuosine reductase QueG
MTIRDILESSLRASGLEHYSFLGEEALRASSAYISEAARSRYEVDAARGVATVALPYSEGPAFPPPWAAGFPGKMGRIGRFARANWYAELVSRLKDASLRARSDLASAGLGLGAKGGWRALANSGLPEKRLVLASGLGSLGLHGLVMVPGHGSAVVLGLLLLPIPIDDARDSAPHAVHPSQSAARISTLCEGCGACVAACPTGALKGLQEDGSIGFEKELCLQYWSSRPGEPPERVQAAWSRASGLASGLAYGGLLYGCDACQEACPFFKPDPDAATDRGLLGPGLPASWLLSASDEAIKAALRGSALGMSWVSVAALKRSARYLT